MHRCLDRRLFCKLSSTLFLVLLLAVTGRSFNQIPSHHPDVCFIIRTYWGHGNNWGDRSLVNLLDSLEDQTFPNWEALIVVVDNRPFPELRDIVRDRNDSRVWVMAEWINYKYAPKDGHAWAKDYHNKLYNVTDMAIRACSPQSTWVVATNGDNFYDPLFVEEVLNAPPSVDMVAIDYYSRYQRPTGLPCDRFRAGPGLPPCKTNEARFCQSDLSANAYNRTRLIAEERFFGLMDPDGIGGANDGVMTQTLKKEGWKVHFVRDRCLVNHSPSPQQCFSTGGVWDDTTHAVQHFYGGSCISKESAMQRLSQYPTYIESVPLDLSFDPNTFTFQNLSNMPFTCLRLRDRAQWHQDTVFGRVCAARVDYLNLPDWLATHPWDEFYDEFHRPAAQPPRPAMSRSSLQDMAHENKTPEEVLLPEDENDVQGLAGYETGEDGADGQPLDEVVPYDEEGASAPPHLEL